MRTLTLRSVVRNGSVMLDNLPADAEGADAFIVITPRDAGSRADGEHLRRVDELLAHTNHGFDLGGAPYLSGEEANDRDAQRRAG